MGSWRRMRSWSLASPPVPLSTYVERGNVRKDCNRSWTVCTRVGEQSGSSVEPALSPPSPRMRRGGQGVRLTRQRRWPDELPAQHQLSKRLVLLHRRMGLGDVGHRHRGADDRLQRPPLEPGEQVLRVLPRDRDPFRGLPRPHDGPDDRKPLPEDDVEFHLARLAPLQEAEEHEPSQVSEGVEVISEGGSTEGVDDEVDGGGEL